MAERFRDLMRPALVDVGARTTRSGGAEAATALAESLGTFSRVSGNLGQRLNTQRGVKEGESVEGVPEFKKGLRGLTAYGEAYNNAALRSYAIRVETDLKETASRLEAEAGLDPEAFRGAMAVVRKSIMAEAPVEAQPLIGQIYDQRSAEGLSRIQTKLAADVRDQDRVLVTEQTAQLTDDIGRLRAEDTPEAAARAEQEEMKLGMLIDAAVADGTYSEAEGNVVRKQVLRSVVAATVKARFAEEMDSPLGDPIGFIEDVIELQRESDILTPDEEEELVNGLFGMLRDRNALQDSREADQEAAVEARFVAGDTQMTIGIIDGTATSQDIAKAIDEERLKPGRGLTLDNALDTRKNMPPKSDPETLATVGINLLEYEEDDIWTLPGLSWADRGALIKTRRAEVEGWKGSQDAREVIQRIEGELDILAGTPLRQLTPEELRAVTVAKRQFYDTIQGMDPEERAGAILEVGDQVIEEVIRNNDKVKLSKKRARLAQLMQPDLKERPEHNEESWQRAVTRVQEDIRELEQRIKK